MKRIVLLIALLLMAAVAAFSDIARPGETPHRTPKPKTVSSALTIKMSPNVNVATLRIPKDQLRQLSAELNQLADENDNTAAVTGGGISRTQTIVSGMFLSIALVFGGVWFVRSGKVSARSGKALVIVAVIAGIGSAATFVYGNAGPPMEIRSITSKLFDKKTFDYWNTASGKINVEVTDGTSYELNVPAPKGWPLDKDAKDKTDE